MKSPLKSALLATLCALFTAAGLRADSISMPGSDADTMLGAGTSSKPRMLDHNALQRNITQSMEAIESLAVQLALASETETAEVRESGKRDFKLSNGDVNAVMKSAAFLIQALAAERVLRADQDAHKSLAAESAPELALRAKISGEKKSVADLREQARDQVRSMHKYAHEDFLRNLHNWIMISEGSLRQDHPAATP